MCFPNKTKTIYRCLWNTYAPSPFPNWSRISLTFDLDLSPTCLNIDRGHLLIKDYLPIKFEDCGTKRKVWQTNMTFDLDLWPSDLNINSDHFIITDYLPTKFKACGTKRSWVISCTRWSRLAWHLTLTFDLLTWISIDIIYSARTIYLPSLKRLVQSVLELSISQGEVD